MQTPTLGARAPRAAAWLAAVLLAACADARETDPTAAALTAVPHHPAAAQQSNPAHLARDLATIRRLAGPFHDIDVAKAAGWDVLVPGCRDNPPVGGMGWHYLNPAHIAAEVAVERPQIMIYEPKKNGRLELVGVEYIIPFSIRGADQAPPTLMGQTFHPNHGDEVWMLHVWPWKANPDGIFATWHPKVSCKYAS